ncbi:Beta-glucanase, GH16 family [Quadrisphaera granulorum]|uniref:Beta-glucanase (GH16 family) n=1 Tax=Quadrisphaera granulorum TaxID=317664 RepID=A0A315ZK13_9ACTN|nr:glycoside hydrolase family 16 protein [Quadrisphaera granulorum]PWJ45168.1 beta-glucanase (GH16 family) [Quadrisphaera granulorum]SZE99177.1 Beta-glucanase, GH16 family [Quadrisphaera granulorum]
MPIARTPLHLAPAHRPPRRWLRWMVVVGVLLGVLSPLALSAPPAEAASTALTNGGFESPQIGGWTTNAPSSSWTFTNNAGIQHNGSAYSSGLDAPEGTQTAFLQGNGSLGSMTQTPTWAAGTYTLTFQAARRWNSIQPIVVTINGTTVGTYTPTSSSFTTITTAKFTVRAGTQKLTLSATDPTGDRTTFIDNIRLTTATPTTTPTATSTATPTTPTATATPTTTTATTPTVTSTATPTATATQPTSTSIANGGFESPQIGGWTTNAPSSSWTFTNNAGIQHNGSAYSSGLDAPEGTQTAFLQGNGSLGSMTQTPTWAAGTYTLTFQAARRWNSIQPIVVTINGTTVGTYTPTSSSFTTITTAKFTVRAGTQKLTLSATDPTGDRTTFIDNIRLTTATPTTTPTATSTATPTPTTTTSTPKPTATSTATPTATAPPTLDLSQYRRTFSEEFNTLSVTTAHPKGGATWYAFPPYGEAGNYSASRWTPDALSVNGGVLYNRAYRSDGNWYSGNISSVDETGAGFAQQYGYFEARVKMPDSGIGSWPAFWLMTTTTIPAVSPTKVRTHEVDVFEWYGTTNTATNKEALVQQASHNYRADGTQDDSTHLYDTRVEIPNGGYPWQDFHTYGVQIDPQFITWYIDGVRTNQVPTPKDFVTGPYYMMVDYGLGGGWPVSGVVDGSTMQVDWVRAYALPGQ